DGALRQGFRGLRPGSSLAKVLAKHGKVRAERRAKRLSITRILAWSDAHRRRTGAWPEVKSGSIREAPGENWKRIDNALQLGLRALEGGSSLAKLLAERRGKWNRKGRPPLRYSHILEWADAHHKRTGQWPIASSGAVRGADGETWGGINGALVHGVRDLPGGDSLARFLGARRGVRNPKHLPRLTIKQILKWSDAHVKREEFWPTSDAGPVHGVPGETWLSISKALYKGRRGLPGGLTLAGLYSKHRGVRSGKHLPPFQKGRILTWADAHRKRTGAWPTTDSGPVHNAPSETWGAISTALREGLRGLPGGTSLAQLLGKKRGKRNVHDLPSLSIKKILAWADDHHRRFGQWPVTTSGQVHAAPGETWAGVASALGTPSRGLRVSATLAQLLARYRGARNTADLPELSIPQILRWADEHHERTGDWPHPDSGPIHGTSENWLGMHTALMAGSRGLRCGMTLPGLLAKHRKVRNLRDLPPLSVQQILAWADHYYWQNKSWPQRTSGPIPGANGETWHSVGYALYEARRGLPQRTSLAKLLNKHRRPEKGL
ncbi:MAG: hypothetical protein IIA66_01340, partial [Planctomycetes bacterium]|nr:hypothetical protein [Planctomycetota bacterium]